MVVHLLDNNLLNYGLIALSNNNEKTDTPPLVLQHESPASNWLSEALPIGNGNIGAMIFGDTTEGRIQFNHKTLQKGASGATDLESYLAFGDLYITNKNTKEISNYRRQSDLSKAIANVKYHSTGTDYSYEYFCIYPDNVIVIQYKAISFI